MPSYKLVCNKPWSEFLTSEIEYCQSRECLASWLLLECSMRKSSMLFERGPSLLYYSRDGYFQALPFFYHSSAFMYYTERKPKNTNGGGLGTKLLRNWSTGRSSPHLLTHLCGFSFMEVWLAQSLSLHFLEFFLPLSLPHIKLSLIHYCALPCFPCSTACTCIACEDKPLYR